MAQDYVKSVRKKSRRPLVDLAEQYDVLPGTVREWVRRARRLELLSGALQGRIDYEASLTPRARALLKARTRRRRAK